MEELVTKHHTLQKIHLRQYLIREAAKMLGQTTPLMFLLLVLHLLNQYQFQHAGITAITIVLGPIILLLPLIVSVPRTKKLKQDLLEQIKRNGHYFTIPEKVWYRPIQRALWKRERKAAELLLKYQPEE